MFYTIHKRNHTEVNCLIGETVCTYVGSCDSSSDNNANMVFTYHFILFEIIGLTVTERRRILTNANLKQMTENRMRPEIGIF